MIWRMFPHSGRNSWPWPKRAPIRVEHVRYVNKPARDDIREKARQMYEAQGKEIPAVLRP